MYYFHNCRVREIESLKQEVQSLKQRREPRAATQADLENVSTYTAVYSALEVNINHADVVYIYCKNACCKYMVWH